jgi:hypothetical protein
VKTWFQAFAFHFKMQILYRYIEDQLLCAIVHEFGSNWGLITDVFAASAPFKGGELYKLNPVLQVEPCFTRSA